MDGTLLPLQCHILRAFYLSAVSRTELSLPICTEYAIYRICQAESYYVKAILYKRLVTSEPPKDENSSRSLKSLINLFDCILVKEYDSMYTSFVVKNLVWDSYPILKYSVECDFCSADHFQSYLQCNSCFFVLRVITRVQLSWISGDSKHHTVLYLLHCGKDMYMHTSIVHIVLAIHQSCCHL